MKLNVKRMTRLAVFTAAALLMFLIEGALPPLIPIAGVKMGLSNVVTLIALIVLGVPDAYIILAARCLLASLFGNVSALMYAVPAGILSLTVEVVLYKLVFPKISLVSVSFVAALVHNFTQVFIASLIAQTNLALLLPFSLIGSLIAGLFVGLVAFFTVKHLPKSLLRSINENKKCDLESHE